MKNLANIAEEFFREFGSQPEAIVSALSRADFLNTHQDYKGLPVVLLLLGLDAMPREH